MNILFLGHSGFLVETESTYLLFDWWTGDLPSLGEKPLYVFASHSHHDHCNPDIFALRATFFLGDDIAPPPQVHAYVLGGNQSVTLDGLVVETLPSTDQGVAFVATVDGQTLYHAGDLHWWHWTGEPESWNAEMARNFKAFVAPLAQRHLDVAFLPLDPRLESAEDWGMAYVLNLAQVDRVIPMHQWGDEGPTERFAQNHPQWRKSLCPLTIISPYLKG